METSLYPPPNQQFWVCHVCGKLYDGQTKLSRHNTLVHSPKEFPCDICGKLFKAQCRVKIHKEACKSNKTRNLTAVKNYRCDLCDRAYPLKQSLKRHIKQKHPYWPTVNIIVLVIHVAFYYIYYIYSVPLNSGYLFFHQTDWIRFFIYNNTFTKSLCNILEIWGIF